MRKETFRAEWVKCGKPNCHCAGSGGGHGPYWYAYSRSGGRLHKRYVGKGDPRRPSAGGTCEAAHPHDAIFHEKTASLKLAMEILGITERSPKVDMIVSRYRELMRLHHPDNGGDSRIAQRVSAAYSYVKRAYSG